MHTPPFNSGTCDSSGSAVSNDDRRGRQRLGIVTDRDLLTVQKPAQYIGGELNSVVKNDGDVDVRFALCFPDTYEVGMSHLGMQILYDLLNSDPRTWAERAFMPMADMEQLLRERGAPLTSLESKRPLAQFDILGFSLQYELCATNVLSMLDLAGLPFYASDRREQDPLVIGGGPYSYHPEAIAPFFDAFFLGDAEEAIWEMIDAIREARAGGATRSETLERISRIEGIYVPSQFRPVIGEDGRLLRVQPLNAERPVVVRRLLPTMEGAPYAKRPVVPNIKTVHNRLSIEVMRGCVRGCRFCQAGYLYRPQRERSPQEILEMVDASLPTTGFEELSLLSLSTADYCSIVPLLKALMDRYGKNDMVAISFPSTRVDALTPEVLEQVQRVRRTGFTVAPEGGSQRLRDVINKGVTDDQILETCQNVFSMGWTGIKLYFILGLPTETDEDLQGIVDLAKRIRALPDARGKDITVSVSTLVPKPHTPFQWAAQIHPEETIRRQRLLAEGLRRAGVNFRYHGAFSTFLEGIFCRAGRELAPVIVRAYELGCRLDAWEEHLDEDAWLQAFRDLGMDPLFFLRERDDDEVLPWDHLSCGISKDYFLKEWKRALRDRPTADCLKHSCSICGACDYDVKKNVLWPRGESERILPDLEAQRARPRGELRIQTGEPRQRLRIVYRKSGPQRYVGHLELAGVFQRAARRADAPLAFSRGFHPLPRLSFGPPLQLGIASDAELVDAYLTETMKPDVLLSSLNAELPPGLAALSADQVPLGARSLQEMIAGHRFRVRWLTAPGGAVGQALVETTDLAARSAALSAAAGTAVVVREASRNGSSGKRRGGKRPQRKLVPLDGLVYDVALTEMTASTDELPDLLFSVRFDPNSGTVRPLEVVHALSGLGIGDIEITKVATFFKPSDVGERCDRRSEAAAGCPIDEPRIDGAQ